LTQFLLIKTATCIFWAVVREFLSRLQSLGKQFRLTVLAYCAPEKPVLIHGTIIALFVEELVCGFYPPIWLVGPNQSGDIVNAAFGIMQMKQKVNSFLWIEGMPILPPSTDGASLRAPGLEFLCNTDTLCLIALPLNISGRLYPK
jgi:hypothetical protein